MNALSDEDRAQLTIPEQDKQQSLIRCVPQLEGLDQRQYKHSGVNAEHCHPANGAAFGRCQASGTVPFTNAEHHLRTPLWLKRETRSQGSPNNSLCIGKGKITPKIHEYRVRVGRDVRCHRRRLDTAGNQSNLKRL